MNENIKWIAAAVAVVGLSIAGVVYLTDFGRGKPAEKPPAAVAPTPAEPAEPEVKYPLAAAEQDAALPSLNDSDAPMQKALEGLFGQEPVSKYVVAKDLVRHIVVTVDNLSTAKVAERLRPVLPAPGKFAVSGTEDAPVLDPANYERYRPLVQLIRSADTRQLVATYTRYYPLFQEAYENLGHPPQYFNDRLVEVIDHLLAAPELPDPIALAQPNVQFEYADKAVESRSAGQKLMIRMGSENARAVKAKLRELRAAIVGRKPGN